MDDRNRDRDTDKEPDLLSETERDTDIKRATNVRNALGPVEGNDDEGTGASEAATEERHSGRSRSGRTSRPGRADEEEF